jgi:hypothetical protein
MAIARSPRSTIDARLAALWRLALAVCVLGGVLWVPAVSNAEMSTFGSPLSVPATLDTAENLNYEGSNIALPGSVFHISHDGADTALWNVAIPGASPSAPSAGQVLAVRLEGCARQPLGAPAPLTQIHFQVLTPTPDGGARIVLTSQAFEIPVCGVGGASGSTVSTYAPTNLCVNPGDYVDFNDEGGFVAGAPPPYPAGVPYEVIGAVAGATMDSFVRDQGTNNGATMSPADRTNHDGFATNSREELLLQATLATGADAVPVCGGTKGLPAPGSAGYGQVPSVPTLRIGKQTDGINHRGIASIAMFCHASTVCAGALTLTPLIGHPARSVHQSFTLRGGKTTHVPIHLPRSVVALARKHRKGIPMRLTAVISGKAVVQTILLRIF